MISKQNNKQQKKRDFSPHIDEKGGEHILIHLILLNDINIRMLGIYIKSGNT